MMFRRASTHYGETPPPETPYIKAQQMWDERMGSARAQAANWRYAAFASMLIAGISCGGLIWQSSRSIVTPYIVEIDGEGAVRNIGPASESYKPSDAVIAHSLANFIRNVRSVSIDPVIVRENWLKAYDYATDRGAMALNDYARDNDPFADVGRRSVNVDVTSVVRASDDSFEIRWTEKTYNGGQFRKQERFTAHLTIVLSPPRTADALHKNPLGLYVHGVNWSKDLSAGDPS
ncbi:MAG: conjugal transfer protein TrbF [Parvularculaceae bacterium]